MKTVVFITGTNAVGKSSLAKEIIKRFGGVERTAGAVTGSGRAGTIGRGGVIPSTLANEKK